MVQILITYSGEQPNEVDLTAINAILSNKSTDGVVTIKVRTKTGEDDDSQNKESRIFKKVVELIENSENINGISIVVSEMIHKNKPFVDFVNCLLSMNKTMYENTYQPIVRQYNDGRLLKNFFIEAYENKSLFKKLKVIYG